MWRFFPTSRCFISCIIVYHECTIKSPSKIVFVHNFRISWGFLQSIHVKGLVSVLTTFIHSYCVQEFHRKEIWVYLRLTSGLHDFRQPFN